MYRSEQRTALFFGLNQESSITVKKVQTTYTQGREADKKLTSRVFALWFGRIQGLVSIRICLSGV